jgi:hypothetical protein
MSQSAETQATVEIKVDLKTARVLERVREQANAEGITLGDFLEQLVDQTNSVNGSPGPVATNTRTVEERLRSLREAVSLAQQRVSRSVPAGYIADDSRETLYVDADR